MSLTSHLKDASSPVRVWLDARFPDLGEALKTLRAGMPPDLESRTIRPVAGVPPSTVGMAIDYRIRYAFGITPVDEFVAFGGAAMVLSDSFGLTPVINLDKLIAERELLAKGGSSRGEGPVRSKRPLLPWLTDPDTEGLPPNFVSEFFTRLRRRVPELAPVNRQLTPAEEDELDRYCLLLALYEEVFRTGRVWPTSPLASVPMEASADEVFAIIPRSWTDDIGAVCGRLFAEVPLTGTAILNPTFALSVGVGGADADLVLGGCLLDIKSTVNPRLDRTWLLQLLGYTLLDSDDACHIDAVGILLARQAVMTHWPLEPLLDAAAGSARPPLAAMRADFAHVVSALTHPIRMVVRLAPVVSNPSAQGYRMPTAPSQVGPHPATLDALGLEEAAALTGRSRSTIRRAISDGRLAAIRPGTEHPAGYGSGFRLSRVEVETLFPPTPEARARLHVCGRECDGPLHMSYIAAQVADLDAAEGFLRQTYHMGALVVEACRPSEVPLDGLLRMTAFYVRGVVSISPDCPWRSWRIVWRDPGPSAGEPHVSDLG